MFGWGKKKTASKIELFNTLGRKMEAFEPLTKGAVKLYSCGPTVYNVPHIGNLRAALLSDIVRRTFEYAGYKVTQVMNITDFGHLVGDGDEGEDKMTVALVREGLALTMENMYTLASKYVAAYREDYQAMNMLPPHAMPRASEHVKGMIAYVDTLIHKGFAYETSDGVYFDTKKFPRYGVLGGAASAEHSRTGVSGEKRDPRDFALWKFDDRFGWDAPWGQGFPGWHIECTAMSTQYLGRTFDIHTGGVDHIAVHHNNELAQAEAANGKPYARYWLHNEFVIIEGSKISKSLGNDVTLRRLKDRGIAPLAYRYWLLTGHYRQSMNFTWAAVEAAQTALFRAGKIFADLRGSGTVVSAYKEKFVAALYRDFDTPRAIALLWELLKDDRVAPGDKRATILDFDRVLGVGFSLKEGERGFGGAKVVVMSNVPYEVKKLVQARNDARKSKNFVLADELRAEIQAHGFVVDDTPGGSTLSRL